MELAAIFVVARDLHIVYNVILASKCGNINATVALVHFLVIKSLIVQIQANNTVKIVTINAKLAQGLPILSAQVAAKMEIVVLFMIEYLVLEFANVLLDLKSQMEYAASNVVLI